MKRLDEPQRRIYIQYLENHVRPKRLKHSLGVAQTAVELAEKYGADPVKAEIAGLLHDCSKGLNEEEMVRAAYAYGLTISSRTVPIPMLMKFVKWPKDLSLTHSANVWAEP